MPDFYNTMSLIEEKNKLFTPPQYDNLGTYKINAYFVNKYSNDECYRELMVSYFQMLPLLEHTVPFEEADYILYMHMYARCDDLSDFVVNELKLIAEARKEGAEIIVLGKAANAEKILNGCISNITFWGDHFTEKLGEKFGMDIKEQYIVYDDIEKHLAIWPVDGCLNKCKFCRRSYIDIKFESLTLETIKSCLDQIRFNSPDLMRTISLRAENLTEYGLDIYNKPMLHELIYLISEYNEVQNIELPIGLSIGEITPEILKALCSSKKISEISMNLETGSDRLLGLIGKRHTTKQAREVFRKIKESNPEVKLSTTIMLGLPTEDVGDVYETAKLIIDTKPNYVHCNYFICSPNLPLAKFPQVSESCREYHLKLLIQLLTKNEHLLPINMEMDSYSIFNRPFSRKSIRLKQSLDAYNKEMLENGFLPGHYGMTMIFNPYE